MPGLEATLGRRAYKEFRVYAVISGQKAIQAVKDQKEISAPKGQLGRPDRPDQLDRRVISDCKGREAFQGQRDQPGRPDLWAHRA